MLDAANIGSSRTLIVGIGRRVALVENDASEAELLGQWLASAGFRCARYSRGQSLVRALRQESFDFLVLDWIPPGIHGIEVLRQVRGGLQSSVPVLLVSTSDSEVDVVTALAHGADDYMVKPLHRRELLARLEALGRRRGMSKAVQPKVIQAGALRMDCESRIASRDDCSIHLTAKEFDLAVVFLLNIGRLLSRAELHSAVWSPGPAPTVRTLQAYISRIRDRLGFIPSNGWRLAPVHSRGYRLQEVTTLGSPSMERLPDLRTTLDRRTELGPRA